MAMLQEARFRQAGAQKLLEAAQELESAYSQLGKARQKILSGNSKDAREYRGLKAKQATAAKDAREKGKDRNVREAAVISLGNLAGAIESRLLKKSSEYVNAEARVKKARDALANAGSSSEKDFGQAIDRLDTTREIKGMMKEFFLDAVFVFRDEEGRSWNRGDGFVEFKEKQGFFRLVRSGPKGGWSMDFVMKKDGIEVMKFAFLDELGEQAREIYPPTRIVLAGASRKQI